MRTYQSGTKDKKKFNKRIAYVVLMSLSVIAIATIITLSLVLGGKPGETDNDGGIHTGGDPVPVFTVPMESFTMGMPASLTRLVYMSSMNNWRTHNGIDLVAGAGTNVLAVTDGKVIEVKHTSLESTTIAIQHADNLVSYYKGLAEDVSVEVGDTVKSGDVIGKVSESMPLERDVGAHLHLEMKLNGKFVDPLNYLPELADK